MTPEVALRPDMSEKDGMDIDQVPKDDGVADVRAEGPADRDGEGAVALVTDQFYWLPARLLRLILGMSLNYGIMGRDVLYGRYRVSVHVHCSEPMSLPLNGGRRDGFRECCSISSL